MIKKKNITAEDKKTWDLYTQNPSDIFDKEKNNQSYNTNKIRFKFDLHGYTLADANLKAKEIILSCLKDKYKEILLITGKGLHSSTDKDSYVSRSFSKLKFSVPEFIKTNNEINNSIISVSDADPKDGGEGAILIKLKNL